MVAEIELNSNINANEAIDTMTSKETNEATTSNHKVNNDPQNQHHDLSFKNNHNYHYQQPHQQLTFIKGNYPEVTFCNISDQTSSSLGALSSSTHNDFKSNSYFNNSTVNIYHSNNNNHDGYLTINNNGKKHNTKRLLSNESADSSTTTSTIDKKKAVIPDGGYGWVVVFASLCVSLIADGISFSFGLIYTELIAYFKESKSKTAWVGSLFFAVPLLAGPVMSNLVDKYGCRKMTIVGGIISASGFALGSLCNSIEMLYLTFGIISGLGLGLGYVTAVVSVAFWFDKKRTFATGIGASGTGIGTFLYAPFTQWLIEEYSWRGATLILAGTMLNTCVFGALMRDPDWLIEENRLESLSQSVTTFSNSSICLDEIKKLLETGAPKETVLDTLVTNYNTEANTQIPDPDDPRSIKKYRSEIFLPTYLNSQDLLSLDELKRESRRSLRHKNERDTISRENLLSMSSGTGGDDQKLQINVNDNTITSNLEQKTSLTTITDSKEKTKYLASIETLSPSEKMTTVPNTPSKSSLNTGSLQSIQEDVVFVENENHHHQQQQQQRPKSHNRFNSSRFSLNENLMKKSNSNEAILEDMRKIHHNRGNSLDLFDNNYDSDHNEDITANLLDLYHRNNTSVIPIQDDNVILRVKESDKLNNMKRFQRKQKPSLKRNISSLRNANYLKNMRIHRTSIHYRGAMLNTHRYRLKASSCPNIYRNSMTTIAKEEEETWYDNFVDIVKSVFDFSLFLNVKFTILNLSTLLLFTWYIIPYLYITDYMLKYKYQEDDSAFAISIIGIFSTIGMVGLGFIGDRPWLNVNISYAICMLLCGLSVAVMPFVILNYPLLLATCALFGLTFASTFSFTPSMVVSLVDLDDFTIAYGLVLLVQGIGSLIGPPLAGLIFEITLRWDDSFYAGGVFIAMSGVLAYVIEVLEKRDEKLKQNKEKIDIEK